MSTIGRRIRARRADMGYTQATLAEKAGLGRSSIAQYERGRTQPRAKELEALAQAMDMSVDELLTGRKPMGGEPAAPMDPEQEILGHLVNHPLFHGKPRKAFHEFLMAIDKALHTTAKDPTGRQALQLHETPAGFNTGHSTLQDHEEAFKPLGRLSVSDPTSASLPTALLTLKGKPKGTPFKSGQVLLLEEISDPSAVSPDEWVLVFLRGRVHFSKRNPKAGIQGFVNPDGLALSNKCQLLGRVLEVYGKPASAKDA